MVIDFHTHVFPDTLAERAIKVLYDEADGQFEPSHNGTVSGLIHTMNAAGIDISVNMPVITRQSQTTSTNQWAVETCSDRIISFGAVFPHTDDYQRDIDFVVSLGLKGIKFHAEYQHFVLDDPQMLRIYDYALAQGLIILHHGGYDPAFPAPYRSSPQQFLNVVNAMQGGTIIAAHLGGQGQWDDVEKILAGSDIYLDTSMGFEYYDHEQFLRIVHKHGADRILFATDSPWSDARAELKSLRTQPLSAKDIEMIASGNARRILGI